MKYAVGMGISMESRFLGAMVGLAVGDACGAPYEGIPAEDIWRGYGGGRKAVARVPVEIFYTDDTEMALGVAEHLVDRGAIEPGELVRVFVRNFDDTRGYGPGARKLLMAVRDGGDWEKLSEGLFPGGSWGNGGAMRVAPVGLFFHEDLNRVGDEAVLSSLPTHRHPLGVDGARMVALGVACLVRGMEPREMCRELSRRAATEEFEWQMRVLAELRPEAALPDFGNTLAAHFSVGTAIGCFVIDPSSYIEVIARAIGCGGDTDTLAAIAGALAGAYLGREAIPGELVERVEGGERGIGYVEAVAQELYLAA